MRPVRIRSTEDLDTVARLDALCFPNETLDAGVLEWSEWWLASWDGEPVAYAGLKSQDAGARAFLCRAGVIPAARGGGLQKALIDVRVARARRLGVPRVWTYVSAWNLKSMNSLIARGFRPYYTQYEAEPVNTFIYLQKHLTTVVKPA